MYTTHVFLTSNLHCGSYDRLPVGPDVDGVNVQSLEGELDQADVDQGFLRQELLVLNCGSFCNQK